LDEKYKEWLNGFRTIVSEQIGKKTYEKIAKNCAKCKSVANDSEMADCVKEIMENFDNVVDNKEKRTDVMETMGYYCFQNHFLERALQVKDQSKGLEDIIKNLNQVIGDEEYFKVKGNTILAKFNQCYCHIGVQVAKEPISETYCYCSLGWLKDLFKILLEKDVKIEMLESIVSGGKSCEFIIHLD
jgi:predicted hydrocarbon binding protein